MRCYSMDYQTVLKLPLRTFWLLNKNVDRHFAEDDIRMLMVAAHAHSGESVQAHHDKLRQTIGTVVEFDEAKAAVTEQLDREGLTALKSMTKASN